MERFEKDTQLSVGALPIDKTILKRQGVTRSDGNFYLFRNFDTKKCRVALANFSIVRNTLNFLSVGK